MSLTIHKQKTQLRTEMRARRRALSDMARAVASMRIFEHLQTLDCWKTAKTVMVYLSVPPEVETDTAVMRLLMESAGGGRRCVVPWCKTDGELGLFHLISPEKELAPGMMGIPEPVAEWRNVPERAVAPGELDLILLPGVAFDSHGGRLGQGGGYYDRLLAQTPRAVTVGLAFSCQMVPEVPHLPHDRQVDFVVTENGVGNFSL